MRKKASLKINFIMNSILTMSQFIFPLITFPYISRILLPVGTGKVSFATSIVSYFALFAQLGIPTYGIRACAKVRDDKKRINKNGSRNFYYKSCNEFDYICYFLFCNLLCTKIATR